LYCKAFQSAGTRTERTPSLWSPPIPAAAEPSDIVIDRAAMKVSVRGNDVQTTTSEFRLVDYLAQHRGQVFTRDVLLDEVWGEMQFVFGGEEFAPCISGPLGSRVQSTSALPARTDPWAVTGPFCSQVAHTNS
jgi:Transcriptional regulatory protein, C terminal